MPEIVRAFRTIIGLVLVMGLVVIVLWSGAIVVEGGGLFGVALGVVATSLLLLSAGIAATLVLISDYLREIRDDIRTTLKNTGHPPLPGLRRSSLPASDPLVSSGGTLVGNSAVQPRRKIKIYKGRVIERDQDGTIYVEDESFKGLLSAEKYINGLK